VVRAGPIDVNRCRVVLASALRRCDLTVVKVSDGISAEARTRRFGHRGAVIWLTGLSGAGKSTIAKGAEGRLFNMGYHVYILDGDDLRRRINADLGFSPNDRRENIRRTGEIAALLADAGLVVITACISPYANDRAAARRASDAPFYEVYVRASLTACQARDPRGLYRRARAGEIREFTGVSAPYEPPSAPDLELDTERMAPDEGIERLVRYIDEHVSIRSLAARAET
jgi:bifunctional enzyme CysN/CysC